MAGADVVVIDHFSDHRAAADALGVHFVGGDASDDDALIQAGIERAQSIVASADSDANNVFITLSARELRSDMWVIARAAVEDTE